GKVSNTDREKKEDTTRSRGRNVDAKEREHGLRKKRTLRTENQDGETTRRTGARISKNIFDPPASDL
ncbi:hypothetical protein M514_08457, partial [Trichuris suis]